MSFEFGLCKKQNHSVVLQEELVHIVVLPRYSWNTAKVGIKYIYQSINHIVVVGYTDKDKRTQVLSTDCCGWLYW
jgi:hypothetical protein